MGKAIKGFILTILLVCTVQAQEAIYPDAVIAEHQVGLFTNRQAWPPQLLQSTISPTALSLSVGTSAGLVVPGVVQIRDEIIKVSAESSGTITVWSIGGIFVTACSNTSPIVVTTSTDHNLTGAERVTITGVGGNTACNVTNAPITRLGVTTFELDGTTGSGAFTVSGSLSATGRGYDGTTAATHLAGSTVTANVVAAQLTQLFREIEALETAGPATGGVAGSPNDIQLNIGGSHGVYTGFSYNGEVLYVPSSATTPATKGGEIVLQEPSGGPGGGLANLHIDRDTVTGTRIYHFYDMPTRLGFFNFFSGRDLDVEYDGRILMHNDRALNMKDSAATDNPVLKLNGSNHFEIGPASDLPGTPDIWFYRDGTVVAKFLTDISVGENSFTPDGDRIGQVGAYNALWRRIRGETLAAGRNGSGTQVTGSITVATPTYPYQAQLTGYVDGTSIAVPGISSTGSFVPSVNNNYRLGVPGLYWKEGYITDLYVTNCYGCGAAGHPVVDTTSIVEDNSDPTKEIRFELGGLTTGTIRVLTPQNSIDYTLAGLETTQTFTAVNTFSNQINTNHILPTTGSVMNIGSMSGGNFTYGNSYIQDMRGGRLRIGSYNALFNVDYHRWETGTGLNVSTIVNNSSDPIITFDSTNNASYSPATTDVDGIRVDADLLPAVTSTFYIGTTLFRWKEIHADKGFFPSGVTAGVTVGSPGCTSGSPASGGDNGRLYWDNGTSTLYVCSNGSPVTVYP